ncbi:MAG: glutamate--tRNA ligase family protein [Bacilli bacterium]|jgi:glutamyl/glutaminyl-tRNA synthetase
MNNNIVTRFAPSPTGLLHIGNYRTALFSYLYAKQNNGQFILRIEDTDKERSKMEYEDNIIESLKWLGLGYDKFYRQSNNIRDHKFYLEKLIEEGKAYVAEEGIIRLKNPGQKITFHDIIRGDITFDTTELKDFIIAKSLDRPLFHLAVVIDDYLEGVTHVIRGEDHISNTPRQILIYEALGWKHPMYAHLPLVLAEDKSKMSKRKGAKSLLEYRDLGYSPEAMLNAIAFIGWNPGTEKEVYTKDELIKDFSLERVKLGGAKLGSQKLEWFNKQHKKND